MKRNPKCPSTVELPGNVVPFLPMTSGQLELRFTNLGPEVERGGARSAQVWIARSLGQLLA
jgi:hypothetical protein